MPLHHLIVGTWTPPGAIFTFAFDDVALTLRLVKRTAIPEDEPISWMTFDHAKRNIYGAAVKKWSSFAIHSPTSIIHSSSHPLSHNALAPSPSSDTRAIFLLAASSPPYGVYCSPFYSHATSGTVFAVQPDGSLDRPVQTFDYGPGSAVHGAVFHPDGRHLFSADLSANKIWLHRRRLRPDAPAPDPELETVAYSVPAPDPHDHPRWVAVHPTGRFLYVLMESGNRICEYAISHDHDDNLRPVFTGRHFSLLPDADDPHHPPEPGARYRGDVCALSSSAQYLFASTRGAKPHHRGFLSAFRLRPDGSIDRRLMVRVTPNSGGHSNAVSPSDWSDDWVAVVEDQDGWLDIYRWQDDMLQSVARVRVDEPGFGMNVLWYD
ncbi:hypothetical protein L249_8507 [Ophiocordyceps polyrhachis-furcata BCC 54312]|uniref:Carboxy-cis,cis-muconate cyclase n=1 Tax=Ophiocordyceps polyrhachis-furcata BCC 54312 TaxID=1330021 RepID=A0A367L6J4_9HYPO|nr:hypothetical protein L249_8507 [Ophiocordyceps polyrhachis-furcata BCC 54312]